MKNFNDLIIGKDNPYLNHIKWNDLINSNIILDNIIGSFLGEKYKGFYIPEEKYNKYDYVWYENNLCMITNISEDITVTTKSLSGLKNPLYLSDYVLAINSENKLVEVRNNAIRQLCDYEIDDFTYNSEGKFIIAKHNNRLYKIQNNNVTGINLLFNSNIIDIITDKFYLYLLSDNRVVFGEINATDNTYYDEILLEKTAIDFFVTDNTIGVLTSDKKIQLYNKKKNKIKSIDLTEIVNINNAKIISTDNNHFTVYDGSSKLISYFLKENNIEKIFTYESEETKNIISLKNNGNHITFSNQINYSSSPNLLYSFVEVDIKKVLIENTVIKYNFIEMSLDLINGQIHDKTYGIIKQSNVGIQLNKGILFMNSEKNPSNIEILPPELQDKTVMIKCKSLKDSSFKFEFNGYFNNKLLKHSLTGIDNKNEIKIFFNFKENVPEVFGYFDHKPFFEDESFYSESNIENKIVINGKNIELEEIVIFDKRLRKDEIDFVAKNDLLLTIDESNQLQPYQVLKTDSKGRVVIQTGTESEKGILKISDNVISAEKDKAFSTIGAKEHNLRISEIERTITEDLSINGHTHKFKEIIEVPYANTNNQGVVVLDNNISNIETKAATPAAVKKAYDKASHEHPYLHVMDGGTVYGPTEFYEISIKKPFIEDGVIYIKEYLNNTGAICFQDDIENGSFIKHSYNGSNSIVQLSSGYLNNSADGFSFGSAVGGKFTEGAFLTSNGILTINALNTKNVVISGYTVTIG